MQKSLSQKTIEKLDNEGLNKRMKLVHLYGLDLGEGTEVYFTAFKDLITIQSGKIKYTIKIEQINNVSIQSIANTIADRRFSIKNAVIGGVLFGNTGAAVGAFSGGDSLEFQSMIINYTGKDGNFNNLVFIPNYSDVKNKTSIKVANNLLYEITDNINYIVNKKNSKKPQITKEL
jgi:hypothetical protein